MSLTSDSFNYSNDEFHGINLCNQLIRRSQNIYALASVFFKLPQILFLATAASTR
jgi:hypothetical protein